MPLARSDASMANPNAEQPVDPDSNTVQPDESPEVTLNRTRHLLARARRTLDAADRRLGTHDDDGMSTRRRPGDS